MTRELGRGEAGGVIPTEDPLLRVIQRKLAVSPEGRARIEAALSSSLFSRNDTIVAVRSDDILSFFDQMLAGHIRLDRGADLRTMAKVDGWFYMTPIYSHPHYSDLPVHESFDPIDFRSAVEHNTKSYAEDIAFYAAFMRNIAPLLVPDWIERARWMLSLFQNRDDEEKTIRALTYPEIIENYLGDLYTYFEWKRDKSPTNQLSLQRIHQLKSLLRYGVDLEQVVCFLTSVVEQRGGIVIGFNRSVLQGTVVSNLVKTEVSREVLHSAPEIAVLPANGIIDLRNAVVAIEPLGEYEDDIVERLGLRRG
jgi:hypothetical protein